MSAPVPTDLKAKLMDSWAAHRVLLFRDQKMTDELIVEANEIFGGYQASGARKRRLAEGVKETFKGAVRDPRIMYVSNLHENGNLALPDPKTRALGSGTTELRWHSDNAYTEVPPGGTLLWAEQVPDDESGQTQFCDMIRAYAELPEDLRDFIEGKHFRHDVSRTSAGFTHPDKPVPASYDDVEGAIHPCVRIHPSTGERALYLSLRSSAPSVHFVELPSEEGEEIMDRLWAHATRDKFVWSHKWRPNDMLVWDNRAVMHRRTAINPAQPRVMHRTLIKGEPVISPWIIESASDAAAE
ncbi:MAG TPA: hypothetical protein DCE33_09370 [Rhodospirillaceae bacterium]|nr:hypothetical protein [Rhodospirillaceae bacterium]